MTCAIRALHAHNIIYSTCVVLHDATTKFHLVLTLIIRRPLRQDYITISLGTSTSEDMLSCAHTEILSSC